MKRALTILFLCCCACLASQPQQIPDIEITGEARIKLPMRKQTMVSDLDKVAPDSLPLLVPHGTAKTATQTNERTGRRAYLQGEMGYKAGARFRASWYTKTPTIPFLRFDFLNTTIEDGWANQDYDLYAKSAIGSLIIAWDLYYSHSTAPTHYSDAYRFMAQNVTDDLALGAWHFSGIKTSINMDVVDAKTESTPSGHVNLGMAHKHRLRLHDLFFTNEFLIAGGEPALSTATRISSLAWFTNIDLVMTTDFTHLLPSLSFTYPVIQRDGTHLLISNIPRITGNDRISMLRDHHWAVQPQRTQTSLLPLDLLIQWQKQIAHPQSGYTGKNTGTGTNISVSHRFSYRYNSPILTDGGYASIPLISFTDQWENHTDASVSTDFYGFDVSQSIALDLAHTKNSNFRLRPYNPMLIAVTDISRRFGDLSTGLSFTQEYLARDHLNNELDSVFRMDIMGEFQLSPELIIYARINDLFNNPGKVWNTIPGAGREAFLGFKFRVR
jgi:hypothetical protein